MTADVGTFIEDELEWNAIINNGYNSNNIRHDNSDYVSVSEFNQEYMCYETIRQHNIKNGKITSDVLEYQSKTKNKKKKKKQIQYSQTPEIKPIKRLKMKENKNNEYKDSYYLCNNAINIINIHSDNTLKNFDLSNLKSYNFDKLKKKKKKKHQKLAKKKRIGNKMSYGTNTSKSRSRSRSKSKGSYISKYNSNNTNDYYAQKYHRMNSQRKRNSMQSSLLSRNNNNHIQRRISNDSNIFNYDAKRRRSDIPTIDSNASNDSKHLLKLKKYKKKMKRAKNSLQFSHTQLSVVGDVVVDEPNDIKNIYRNRKVCRL